MFDCLRESEYAAIIAAIKKQPYDRKKFESGISSMRSGSGLRPQFAKEYPEFPYRMADLRSDVDWSISHVNRHQAACDAACRAYWQVMVGLDPAIAKAEAQN